MHALSLEWQRRARCAGVSHPDRFFPDRGKSKDAALRLCNCCPVKLECLEYAVQNRIEEGIWGGMGLTGRRRYAVQLQAQSEPELADVCPFLPSKKALTYLRIMHVAAAAL